MGWVRDEGFFLFFLLDEWDMAGVVDLGRKVNEGLFFLPCVVVVVVMF